MGASARVGVALVLLGWPLGASGEVRVGQVLIDIRLNLAPAGRDAIGIDLEAVSRAGGRVSDDGRSVIVPGVAPSGWYVRYGDQLKVIDRQGMFLLEVPGTAERPAEGGIYFPADPLPRASFALDDLVPRGQAPRPIRFEVEVSGPCGMNGGDPAADPGCHPTPQPSPAASAPTPAATAAPAPSPSPTATPAATRHGSRKSKRPLKYGRLGSYPAGNQGECELESFAHGTVLEEHITYWDSVCQFQQLTVACCVGELNPYTAARAKLGGAAVLGCKHVHRGRYCQELVKGDLNAEVAGKFCAPPITAAVGWRNGPPPDVDSPIDPEVRANTDASGIGLETATNYDYAPVLAAGLCETEVAPGGSYPVTIHNNGCTAETVWEKVENGIPGTMAAAFGLGGKELKGLPNPLIHFDTIQGKKESRFQYEGDRPLVYRVPADACVDKSTGKPRVGTFRDSYVWSSDGSTITTTFVLECKAPRTTTGTGGRPVFDEPPRHGRLIEVRPIDGPNPFDPRQPLLDGGTPTPVRPGETPTPGVRPPTPTPTPVRPPLTPTPPSAPPTPTPTPSATPTPSPSPSPTATPTPSPTPVTGCAALSGSYTGNGGCQLSSTSATAAGNQLTLSPLGANGAQGFSVSGSSGASNSSNLILFGQPGHSCSVNCSGAPGGFVVNCSRPGASCAESFHR